MRQRTFWAAILLIAGFALDRILKHVALSGGRAEGIPGVVSFYLFRNTGIAFSLPFSGPIIWLLSVAILAGVCLLAVRDFRKRDFARAEAYCLFVIGACSNLFDRIAYGFTTDYLIFFSRSAVNIADGMIVAGALWLVAGAGGRTKRPS